MSDVVVVCEMYICYRKTQGAKGVPDGPSYPGQAVQLQDK